MMNFKTLENYSELWPTLSLYHFLMFVILSSVSWSLYTSLSEWIQRRKTRPPGPIGLPWVGSLPFLGLEPHKTLWRMKDKYGDIIGLNMGTKYTVILNEYYVMKEVLTHVGALDRAPNLFEHIPRVGFITENGDKWQEQRRFCLSATRDLGLGRGQWEDLVMEEVFSFTDELQKSNGKPVDISHSLGSSISSNIISLLIGRRLKKDEEADKVQLSVDFSDVSFTYMGPSSPASVVPGLRKLMEIFRIAGYDRAARIIRKFHSFVKEEVARHKNLSELKYVPDFINTYLGKIEKVANLENFKHFFSEKMLEGNLNILFLASSDTIFSSIGWLLRLMADHKHIQEKAYHEIMDVLGKDGRARYEERHKIPYTFAVLMESQRFSSIVPLSTTRRANQDIPVRGFVIPKGSEIAANLWALHNDPNYWKEPEKFIPERFLTDDGSKLAKQPPSFAPFSIGRRNCPGETIAWMEILVYFTEILKKFEVSTSSSTTPGYKIVNGLVAHLAPHALCFKERK